MSRTSHSFTSIYGFARSRYPLFDTRNTFDSEHDTLMDFTNDTIADLSNTRLKKVLEQLIMDVPSEIRLIVSKYCSPCLISSLHTVKRIPSLDISGAHSLQTVVKYRNDNRYLAAAQTSIFGEDYISSIAFNKSKGVPVSSESKGIIFTIGRYGLRALRIVYADNSTSAWLGDPENGWTGVMYSNNIQELYMIREVRATPKSLFPALHQVLISIRISNSSGSISRATQQEWRRLGYCGTIICTCLVRTITIFLTRIPMVPQLITTLDGDSANTYHSSTVVVVYQAYQCIAVAMVSRAS